MNIDWAGPVITGNESDQGSDAWKMWRSKGLGSSDAATLIGMNPWKDLDELFLEKTGQKKPFEGNAISRRGNDLEPLARELYNGIYGTKMEPAIRIHKECDFIRASFDGIDHTVRRVLEIKCRMPKGHAEDLKGMVPHHYMPQCQWLLMVSGYQELDYFSFSESSYITIQVASDLEMQAALIQSATEFWDKIKGYSG